MRFRSKLWLHYCYYWNINEQTCKLHGGIDACTFGSKHHWRRVCNAWNVSISERSGPKLNPDTRKHRSEPRPLRYRWNCRNTENFEQKQRVSVETVGFGIWQRKSYLMVLLFFFFFSFSQRTRALEALLFSFS